jgi:hypothetical protein
MSRPSLFLMVTVIPGLVVFLSSNCVVAQTQEEPEWGFKIQVPTGWKCEKEASGSLLGHDRIPGLIMVPPHSAADIEEMRRQMGEGLQEEGLQLRLSEELHPFGKNALSGMCDGFADGQLVKGLVVGAISSVGGGAYVIAITTPEKYGHELRDAAETIVKGMQYPKFETSDLMRQFVGTWVNSTTNTQT